MAEIKMLLKFIKIGDKILPFPDQNYSAQQAAKALSGANPELTNASLKNLDDSKTGKMIYVMEKTVGTHG